jgi:molybdate transport system substrate-binding protein
MNRFIRSAALACAAVFAAASSATAADILVLAAGTHVDAFKEIVPQFERASGHKVTLRYEPSPVMMKNIESGEPFDVVVAIKEPMEETAKKGFFAAGERPMVGAVGLGAAVRAGAPKPDIGTVEAFKQTMLQAKGVSIIPAAVNGKHFLSVFARLGIADQMKPKIVAAKAPADVAGAVVRGDADIALFIANGLRGPGLDYVGPVPPELDQKLVNFAAVSAKAKEPQAAAEFVKYLTQPPSVAIMKANGLEMN